MIGETAQEFWPRQVAAGTGLAFATFLIALLATCASMEQHLDRLHPHAEQNSLAAFYIAVPSAFFLAMLVFAGVMLRAYVRRQRELAQDAAEQRLQ